jgi:iron complex outermembrane receptor protein
LSFGATPALAQDDPVAPPAAGSAATPAPAGRAQSESNTTLGDIVVTATRRESRVQDTPIAISALDSSALERNNITDLTRLSLQVPSLFVGGGDGFGSSSVTIRGIGSLAIGVGADEGVGVYIDGVYQAKPYGNVFEFVDIDRVEVLRGPQGTLYGRNATGGAINIVSKQPGNDFAGQVNAGYTNYQGVRVSGYVMIPIVKDTLSFKIAAGSNTRDGWAYDPVRKEPLYGTDNKYVSASLRWRPTEGTDVVLSGRAGRTNADVQFKDANDTSLPLNIFPADYPGFERSTYAAATLSITQDLGFASLVSVSGYEHGRSKNAQDSDLTPAYFFEFDSDQKSSQLSEELRLVSKNSGPFSWLVGAMYFHESSSVFLPFQVSIANLLVLFDAHLKTDSYSAYAEGTYKLTDKLSFTAGARYNRDSKHWLGCTVQAPLSTTTVSPALCAGPASVPDSRAWGSFTPHFVINYQASKDLLLYASATRGFRSGGWNFTDQTSFHSGFNPETIWSYEGGVKSEMFGRRLRMNIAGFYANYSNLQVRVNDGPFLATRNAGSARIYGVELESNLRLFDALDLSASASYLNAEYTTFLSVANGVTTDYAGHRLNRSPEWNLTFSGQYGIDLPGFGHLTPRAEYHYISQVFYSQENIQPQGADPYHEVNLSLKLEPDNRRWSLTAFADNLTNNQFRTHTFPGNLPGQIAATYSTPRIYGVRAQLNW